MPGETNWQEVTGKSPAQKQVVMAREITGQEFKLYRSGFCWYFSDDHLFYGFEITHWKEIKG
ncbi:hypothetical protein [Erwinia phage Gungnir39]|nr:hypothetical protein [Erwinia phage Gungnir39]